MNIISTIVLFSVVFLTSCKFQHAIDERNPIPLSKQHFEQAAGFKLDYQIYIPNSFTGWTPNASNQLIYDEAKQSYRIQNLDISSAQVDSWGARFKITNVDWTHEFGFTKAQDTPEQSKFGIRPQGSILQLKHIFYSSDMYFELPINANAHYLHAEFKVTQSGTQPTALLFISFSQNKL